MAKNDVNPIEETGKVNISDEVVATLASIAANGVKGVASMTGSIAGGFAELLGKKNVPKGVKVSVTENDVVVDLFITVEYGVKIPDDAWKIQEKVKGEIETMTGLNVTAVNVHVDGVNVLKTNKDTEINNEAQEDLELADD